MQHKCKAHDRGNGQGAVAYLMGLKDSQGRLRVDVQVLRGNPEATARLIDSIKNRCKYTSTVIAWALEDDPTPAEIEATIDDWERAAFAGLRKSQYTFVAVLHVEDDGSKHVHILTPRINLEDGRALNIAPPGHEYYFAKWREAWNQEKGWARPEDPSRARLVQPGHKAYLSAEEMRSGITSAEEDPKQMITEYLTEQIAAGKVETREDVLEVLAELGEINRAGKDYVSVRLEEGAKPIRLKGLLYGDNFSPELIREVAAAAAARPRGRAKPDPAAAAAARAELERAVAGRAGYNQNRYSKPARVAGQRAAERQAAAAAAQRAIERISLATQYRDKYIEPAGAPAAETANAVAVDLNSPTLPNHDWIGRALRRDDGVKRDSAVRENFTESTDEIKSDEQRILQQSGRSEILQDQRINSYPFITYNSTTFNGVKYGLHEPGAGESATSRHDHQYAAGIGGVQTLSSLNLDARWPGIEVLLPGAARGDLVGRAEGSADQVRRANRGPGTDAAGAEVQTEVQTIERAPGAAAAAAGVDDHDAIRDAVNAVIDAAQRAARAASDAVGRAVAAVQRVARSTDSCAAAASRADHASEQATESVIGSIRGVKAMAKDELEIFKCEISISDFAMAEYGYEIDKRKSSKNSLVLKSGGDEIIVTRGDDGHDIYFSRGDERDCGSIIDFVKNRVGDNNDKLVRVRQALRPWAPGAKAPSPKRPAAAPARPVAVSKDMAKVLAQAARLEPYQGSYLADKRGLDVDIIKAFDVREDSHGNACFVHRNRDGVTGWEKRNAEFKGFADGGERGLYLAKPDADPVSRIVVTEAAIDALSHAQLRYQPGTLYVSTGGSNLSPAQDELVRSLLVKHPAAQLVLAMDNDAFNKAGQAVAFEQRAGEKMARHVAELAPAGMPIVRDTPEEKDWNQDLQNVLELEQEQSIENEWGDAQLG